MIRSVTKGRPNTAMMPWENILSEQEILSVVNYIRQKFMSPQK
jgi:mono/diheme cytochrome c family protein